MVINPDHPVSQWAEANWHKLLAMMLYTQGLDSVTLTLRDVEGYATQYPNHSVVVKSDTEGSGSITIALIPLDEAKAIAARE